MRAPTIAGIKETTIIPIITKEKCSLTTGILPKKYPAPQQMRTQAVAPSKLYLMKVEYLTPVPPETKGDKVLIIGINLANEIAMPPCFSKNASVFFMFSSLINLPKKVML